jgi:hypothetical protein
MPNCRRVRHDVCVSAHGWRGDAAHDLRSKTRGWRASIARDCSSHGPPRTQWRRSHDPRALQHVCARLFNTAADGSLLLMHVEHMQPIVQREFPEILDSACAASSVRFISGTTVSLFDRVSTGRFSGRLFYRLNVIHLCQTGAARPFVRRGGAAT